MTSDGFPYGEAIAALELFRDMPAPALAEVIAMARVRALPRGARVFDQGEPTRRAHALLSGAVRILQAGGDGGQVVIRFIGPGEIFGSVAIYTDHRYPADAIAMVDSLDASWSESDLIALFERHPRIAINMIGIVGRRLGELQERFRELATQRAEQRIAHTLLRLAEQVGRSGDGGMEIDLPLRRKDIADISGTTLYTASRVLAQWERDGLLASGHHRLTLRAVAELERLVEP